MEGDHGENNGNYIDADAVFLKHYGISPWEIEVFYEILSELFDNVEITDVEKDEDYASMIDLWFPFAFNDSFLQWFGRTKWDKFTSLLKELKRRRGGGKAIKTYLHFEGHPSINFVLGASDGKLFNSAIEKMDFVIELLKYHLDPEKLPGGIENVIYEFDRNTARWYLSTAISKSRKYILKDRVWKPVT